ncbi:MAG: gluconate 2-dehydrogenase subunit 3 family protein [Pseudomonadota bacterium]
MRVQRERTARIEADSGFLREWREELVSRRAFLARMAGVSVATLFPLAAGGVAFAPKSHTALSDDQQAVLAAVQQHLFPSEPDIPGASEINALAYLNNVLADPKMDGEEKAFISNGIGWLEELVKDESGKSFAELNTTQREQMLRRIEQSRAGENWLATILMYIFEALLGDPAYGGNPEGIGWQWLEHPPGFPRPPADKIYGKL